MTWCWWVSGLVSDLGGWVNGLVGWWVSGLVRDSVGVGE